MKQLQWCLLIMVPFLFIHCSGPKVISFTGNAPDFGSYYTYRVKHPGTQEQLDLKAEEFFERVETAINNQMEARGYENAGVADLVVGYNLILDNEVDYRLDQTSRYNYNYTNRYSQYGYPYWLEKDEYTKGTLLVELREDLNKKLVWQASLDLKYNTRSSSKKKVNPVENAFQEIFSEYPYLAGSSKIQILENPRN